VPVSAGENVGGISQCVQSGHAVLTCFCNCVGRCVNVGTNACT